MQVIAGRYKGHFLKMPKGAKIRPTSQKVKAALFNILGQGISGASFLELFAGSASVGIEALSRGAKRVVLVENSRNCLKAIKDNLAHLKIDRGVSVLPSDSERAISMLVHRGEKFDFVFLDPPYYEDKLKNSLIKVGRYDILNARAWVIAEHKQSQILPQELGALRLMFAKRYGDTALSFYQKGVEL